MTSNLFKEKLTRFFLFLFILTSNVVLAQEIITVEDYQRALSFERENYYNKTAFNLHIQPYWFPDSTGVWYVNHSPEAKKYLKISFPNMERSELFDHNKLAKILSDELETKIEATNLPIQKIVYKNPTELEVNVKGKTYILNTNTYTLKNTGKKEEAKKSEIISPNKEWIAFAKDYNLYIKSTKNENVRQLSTTGEKNYEYASYYGWYDIIEGENGDRPEYFRMEWSADSKWISTDIIDLRTAEKMYLLDWSIDSLYRPKLLSYYRGSPGDTTMVYMEPVFFNVTTGKEIKVDLPRSTHINSISKRW